jgi:hypothetical protein
MAIIRSLGDYLKSKKVTTNSTISEYCTNARQYLQWRLGQHSGAIDRHRKALQGAIDQWMDINQTVGPEKRAGSFGARLVTAMEPRIQDAISDLEPLPPPAPALNYDTLVGQGNITVSAGAATTAIGGLNTTTLANYKKKACSVYARGQGYRGHGPTSCLGVGVLHCHVGNGDGIGFRWVGTTLNIHGWGVKDDTAPKAQGNSGYKWN